MDTSCPQMAVWIATAYHRHEPSVWTRHWRHKRGAAPPEHQRSTGSNHYSSLSGSLPFHLWKICGLSVVSDPWLCAIARVQTARCPGLQLPRLPMAWSTLSGRHTRLWHGFIWGWKPLPGWLSNDPSLFSAFRHQGKESHEYPKPNVGIATMEKRVSELDSWPGFQNISLMQQIKIPTNNWEKMTAAASADQESPNTLGLTPLQRLCYWKWEILSHPSLKMASTPPFSSRSHIDMPRSSKELRPK